MMKHDDFKKKIESTINQCEVSDSCKSRTVSDLYSAFLHQAAHVTTQHFQQPMHRHLGGPNTDQWEARPSLYMSTFRERRIDQHTVGRNSRFQALEGFLWFLGTWTPACVCSAFVTVQDSRVKSFIVILHVVYTCIFVIVGKMVHGLELEVLIVLRFT